MTKIQIIKKQDSYAYKYNMIDENNKTYYVTKSGFKTPEEALERAKKSYEHRINSTKTNPIHVTKTTHPKKKQHKPYKIKNLKISDGGYRIIETLAFCTVTIVAVSGTLKIVSDMKEKFPVKSQILVSEEDDIYKQLITERDCDFNNIHIILRSSQTETNGVAAVTSDMLNKLGVSNEIVSKDSDLSEKVNAAINNYPDNNIVVINIESDNEVKDNAIVKGDCSNRREYSSDVLASCINESLNEYSFNSTVKSGKKADIWRTQTDIEVELTNSGLINKVSQLSIDLPQDIALDQLTKNDAAASIVEGIMRWATLDITERYKDIYYTTQYGDTLVSVANDHGITIEYMEENSDIDMHKGVRVGNTVLVAPLPKVVTNKIVYNPCTTTDPSSVKQITNTYIVQSGDTVTKIANMYGMKIEDIVVPSGNINNIHPGDALYITTYNLYETHNKVGTEEKHI